MAKTPELQRFYGTKAWQDLRWKKIIEAGGKCERCGKDFSDDMSQLIAHHKEHLTDENLADPFVALNPDNVEIVCRKCHAHYHDDGIHRLWSPPVRQNNVCAPECRAGRFDH